MSERAPKQQLEIVSKIDVNGNERHYVPSPDRKLGQQISEDYYHELSDDFEVVNNFEEPANVPTEEGSTDTTEKPGARDWEANPITDEERANGKSARRSQIVEDGRKKGFDDFYKEGEKADKAVAEKRAASEKQEALDKRRNSAEVSALNDAAELRIYGSRGRKYTHPRTGEDLKEVKSARERIMDDGEKGVFPGASVSHKDRKAFADAYENSINDLLEQGYELTQAEYLTSMRMRDLKVMHDIDTREQQQVLKFMSENGMSQEDAQVKAKHLFDKLRNAQMSDADRLKLAKENGYMTMGEFMNGVNGDQTPDTPDSPDKKKPSPEPTTLEKMEAVEFTDDQKEAMKKANEAAKEAREKYEDIKLRRESHTVNFKKGFRGKDLQEAYDAWMEAENVAGMVVADAYTKHGINISTEVRSGNPDRAEMKALIALANIEKIDAHTKSLIEKIEKSSEVEGKFKSLKKFSNKFAEMYANFGALEPGQNPEEESRRSKLGRYTKKAIKAAGIVAVGAGTAAVLAPFFAAGIGTAGAAGVAGFGMSRVARGGLIAQIKKAENQRLGVTRAKEDQKIAHEAIMANVSKDNILNPTLESGAVKFKETADKVVKQNRIRTGAGFVLGAAGGAIVEGLADDAWNGIKVGTGKVGEITEDGWNKVGDWFDNNSPSENIESNTAGGSGVDTSTLDGIDQASGGNGEVVTGDGEGAGSIADQIADNNGETTGGIEGQPDFVGNPEIADDQVNPGIGGGAEDTLGAVSTEDFSQYEYPFDWAAKQYGESNAMAELHRLSDIAAQNGYNVEWHNVADGNGMNDWLEINGNSSTEHVLGVLSKYSS